MTEKVKIVVTVPPSEADNIREVIGRAGGGQIGEYTYCSYSVVGTGRFVPGQKSNPAIGKVGQQEQVTEERIEVTCNRDNYLEIVKAIRLAHSYEEPAIDIYPLLKQ